MFSKIFCLVQRVKDTRPCQRINPNLCFLFKGYSKELVRCADTCLDYSNCVRTFVSGITLLMRNTDHSQDRKTVTENLFEVLKKVLANDEELSFAQMVFESFSEERKYRNYEFWTTILRFDHMTLLSYRVVHSRSEIHIKTTRYDRH